MKNKGGITAISGEFILFIDMIQKYLKQFSWQTEGRTVKL